ncbi:type III glutamate--ammonia ligase [Mycolicibacterium madagascariense]|uniref:Type III glutamate--ammonia ligase n=1 Tax=Mycolicibacterium madagascariense TaxID=212765 RepID=A0A7I7X8T5_9MYCO|nr:type III glutamate--ammonia ligase [Mycolicibacterium madagascariense]MCV7012860.1 type III glutamate--ammonia ligase [Mycolicibacterium madagascariense]BBZ26106.1 type III glutamate--ammonia ligase [Mycolicibacterium madagascariense]
MTTVLNGQHAQPGTATTAAAVADRLAESGVKYAAISFVDMHGKPKAKMVPLNHLGQATKGSEMFTGAALDGVPQDVNDDEVAPHPDLDAGIITPFNREVAWFPGDLWIGDAPFEACSRQILKRVTADAATLGYTFNLGIETEFFLLTDDRVGTPAPASLDDDLDKPCYDLRGLLHNYGIVDEIVTAMNELGWDVYSFDHEDGNGQFETDFTYTDAVSMSDRFVFFRMMVGEIARKHGLFASWMPKPFADRTGSGAHYNMSLAGTDGANLFEATDDPRNCGLSTLGYQFIAGVLRHAPAICAVIAPTVNSYKRLVKQGSMSGLTWAPIFACYGDNNRTNMLRIPRGGGRVECRAADSANNPYLGAALMLAAGLEGIREGLDPGEPNRDNLYRLSDADLVERGIGWLPRSLDGAIDALESDPLARSVFGSAMFDSFVSEKRLEWESYTAHVSAWETDRYLRFF